MFEKEPQSVRAAVLVLVLAAMPVETHYNTMFPAGADEIEEHQVNSIDSEVESYTNVVIFKLIDELKLSEEFFEGYMSLIKDDYSSLSTNYSSDSSELTPYGRSDRDAMINTFKIVVESQSENSADDDENRYKLCDLRMKIIIEVLLFLVINNFYDGRGRVIIRNLTKLLECSPVDMVLLESILAHSLVQQLGLPGGKDIEAKEDNEDVDVKKKKKAVRYMKIGAVSLGAGAILAVTGGLAAPALAAAAVVVFGTGGAAVAGAATVTGINFVCICMSSSVTISLFSVCVVLGTVFGSAGAGLTGYKMMRRTSGLNEFEFEPCNGPVGIDSEGQVTDKDGDSTNCNSLAVMICISGWMNEREDHRRVFGILPKFNSNITARERLSRFYMMHNPHQLLSIDEEVKQYELNPEAYAAHIADVYNIDIENDIEGALLPPPFPSASAQNLWAEASEGMGDCVAYMSNSMALRLNPEKKNAASTEKTMQSDSCEPTASSATESKANPNAAQSNLRQLASKSGKAAAGDGGYGSGLIVNDQITAEDGITFRDRYWNWRDCELSSSYDMYLLRYETDLQLELGRCIRKLMKDLTASATQQLLTVTVFAALMSAVLLPVTLVCEGLCLGPWCCGSCMLYLYLPHSFSMFFTLLDQNDGHD